MVYAFTAASQGKGGGGARVQKFEGPFSDKVSVLWARFVCYGRFFTLANHRQAPVSCLNAKT